MEGKGTRRPPEGEEGEDKEDTEPQVFFPFITLAGGCVFVGTERGSLRWLWLT
jgi:hypothetical protein